MNQPFIWVQETLHNAIISLLLLVLFLAVVTDLYNRKIPNLLIVLGLFGSLFGQILLPQGLGFMQWSVGVLLGFICFFPLYALRGMAAGDVKLMMVVGGFVGFPLVLTAALYSYASGGVMAMMIVLAKGRFKQVLHNIKTILTPLYIRVTSGVDISDGLSSKEGAEPVSVGRMPYALAIAAGTLLALYFEATQMATISN